MTTFRHVAMRTLAALAVAAFVSAVTVVLVIRSGWFHEKVRTGIVSQAEKATGGRVELGEFSFDWKRLVATVSPFVLHGKEKEDEPPLLRIQSVTLQLRLISLVERKVDLAYLRVEQPEVRIVFYPDGSTNLPSPAAPPSGKTWAQNLLDLAIGRYEVNRGTVEFDLKRFPMDIRGEELRLVLSNPAHGPSYRGELSSERLRVAASEIIPAEMDFSAAFVLSADRLDFSRLRLQLGQSVADLRGSLTDLRSPQGVFDVRSTLTLKDAASIHSLPVAPLGFTTFDGNLNFSTREGWDFEFAGKMTAKGIHYERGKAMLDASGASDLRATPQGVQFRSLKAAAIGTDIAGSAELRNYRSLHFEGQFSGLTVRNAAAWITDRAIPWNGATQGTAVLDVTLGQPDAKLRVAANVTTGGEGIPVEGQVEAAYDQQSNQLQLGTSHLATPSTRLEVSGTLGQALDVRAYSTNLDDILPALLMVRDDAPRELPLRLDRGDASASGTVTGPLDNPRFQGQIALNRVSIGRHAFSRITSDVDASAKAITLRRLAVTRGPMMVNGDVSLIPQLGGFSDAAITAQVNVRNAPIEELAKEFEIAADVSGTATAAARISGTFQNPQVDASLDVTDASAYGERFSRIHTPLHYESHLVRAVGGDADFAGGKLFFSAVFQHPVNQWTSGDLAVSVTAKDVSLSQVAYVRDNLRNVDARIDGGPDIQARIDKGRLRLQSIRGNVHARRLSLYQEPLGDMNLKAGTSGTQIKIEADGQVRGTAVEAQGEFPLEWQTPGSGSVRFSRITVATLYDIVMLGAASTERPSPPPFEGFLEGGATFTLPLFEPGKFHAEARVETLQLNARGSQALQLGVQPQDVVIRNNQPIRIALTREGARIQAARFSARDTDLEVVGAFPFKSGSGADLAVKGTVNLAVLQLLNRDLLARGSATVAASIRGSLRNPQMNGRMELNGASLYLNDLPNGVDNASGVILFDRNRATVERLTAETGGGTVSLGGFIEFGEPLVYRLRAEARQVRVRYPAEVSVTATAQLALNGNSAASTLSGTVTLIRATINAGADFGRTLASGAEPSVAPESESDYLRGVRFDVRIESAPTFELQSSLARDLQSTVDLRLRGTARRPTLYGDISISSGEIELFGTRYTVNRGDIRFLNPVRIEPTLDVNLETKVRGITVSVSLTGSPQRLNVGYSSDPPLQAREIVALLAVGRDPTASTRFASTQVTTNSSVLGDAGGLLGQAVSQQLSNRVQRFFGSSRVKIDPSLAGIDNLPEARLTLEQQVSRDVTLTYITNLNRTQEQIVRVQWDLSPQWSAIAVRQANGTFGIDVQFRKRFR